MLTQAALSKERSGVPERREDNYQGLDFGESELRAVMRSTYDDLIAFVTTPEFTAVYLEMMSLPPTERPRFIAHTLFRPEGLRRRGIVVPDGILIQTSSFGDRRPTLFVVKKMMPLKYHVAWENMNLTFNNEFRDKDVDRSEENAWRPPLPVTLQNALLAAGANLESVPVECGVKSGLYEGK